MGRKPQVIGRHNIHKPRRGDGDGDGGDLLMAGTFTNLLYHIVFSTKERYPLVTPSIRPELYKYIGGIIRRKQGTLLEVGGMPDHIHLVTKFKPNVSVAEMLRVIKANSSKWVNERRAGDGRFAWQIGYSAFSVSESRAGAVRDYVRNQEHNHRAMGFREELIALLDKHGVEYDEQYLWS